ncbi:MAG: Uma2 family endonuclease [Tepidisphaeraceae bacterium]
MSQSPVQPPKRYTEEEYFDLEAKAEEKHEFHDGLIVAMAGGSVTHTRIANNLSRALGNRLAGSPCEPLGPDLRLHIPAYRKDVYPDMMTVCGPIEYHAPDKSKGTILNARVVIEVLSPTTAHYDRREKRDYYLSVPSVDCYVLIEQDGPHVDILSRNADGSWGIDFAHSLEGVAKLPTLGIELPLAEIYERVEFGTLDDTSPR